MADSWGYPPAGFYFKVVFGTTQGKADTSFQEVSGIYSEIETEPVVEGGNQYVRQLPKSIKHGNLVLKRGIASMSSPLVVWCREVLETNFMQPIVTTPVSVYLMDEEANPLRAWAFSDAYPVKWSVDAFNSTKNEVAIETIELSYMYFSRMI